MSALTAVWEDEPNDWNLRMKDLCKATGISRQVVHFYIPAGPLALRERRPGKTWPTILRNMFGASSYSATSGREISATQGH